MASPPVLTDIIERGTPETRAQPRFTDTALPSHKNMQAESAKHEDTASPSPETRQALESALTELIDRKLDHFRHDLVKELKATLKSKQEL